MNIHKHARMTPHGRYLLVQGTRKQGLLVRQGAHAAGASERTAYKWLAHCRSGGTAALADRSLALRRCSHRLPSGRLAKVERFRRKRWTGPRIAREAGISLSTVGAVLRRPGPSPLSALEPKPPVVRHQRKRRGELIHIDTKKLARVIGLGHRSIGERSSQGVGPRRRPVIEKTL